MCRNIRTLYNFEPPATESEIRAAALQFVRKISGFNAPSKANADAFELAVDEVAASAAKLLASLQTSSPPRDRDVEAGKARERARARFVRLASRMDRRTPLPRGEATERCLSPRGAGMKIKRAASAKRPP